MWKRIKMDRYYEALEVLPPALQTGKGFLLGEPETHRNCQITGYLVPVFTAFINVGGKYFEGPAMSRHEFECFDVRQLCAVSY